LFHAGYFESFQIALIRRPLLAADTLPPPAISVLFFARYAILSILVSMRLSHFSPPRCCRIFLLSAFFHFRRFSLPPFFFFIFFLHAAAERWLYDAQLRHRPLPPAEIRFQLFFADTSPRRYAVFSP
jgi:hypothetical protein